MLLVFTLTVLSFLPLLVNAASNAARYCNGYRELCDRSYGNITFVGAHNSYDVGINNLSAVSVYQDYDNVIEFTEGVRLLQVQAHSYSDDIYLCYNDCELYNGGTLLSYLQTIKLFFDANTVEVLTLLIVNSDNLPATQFASVFVAAGVDSLSYSPHSASLPASGWPTLGSLLDAKTPLVAFLSAGANFETAPYLIDEFSNVWETPNDTVDGTAFQCKKDRGTGDISTSMFLINHFLDIERSGIPYVVNANATNAASGPGSLGEEVAVCARLYNRYPNFLLVDYFEYGEGSVFKVAAAANGVVYLGTTVISAQPAPSKSRRPHTLTKTSPASTGRGSSGGGVSSGFGTTTLFSVGCVILGAFSVFI